MANPQTRSTDKERVIAELFEELARRYHRGGSDEAEKYLAAHPQHASELRLLLPTLELLGELSQSGALPPAAAAQGADARASGGVLGEFRIIREIGRGGMGVVYEAEQISLERRVALKVLPYAGVLDERHLRRFRNEARAAAGLHHPSIVPVYAVGSDRGVHFYAMQYIEGRTLADTIRDARGELIVRDAQLSRENAAEVEGSPVEGRAVPEEVAAGRHADSESAHVLDDRGQASAAHSTVAAAVSTNPARHPREHFRQIARLMSQAADALDHAHQLGVIHRDVKPANILVEGASKLWITDFGLAQLHADTGLTRSGDVLGTFRYMSPEQTSGQRAVLDHRTDLYSLGATFYELLTLEPPFDGETREELLYQILNYEPRAPRLVNRAIPVELETIVLKCLAKSPAERYRTAADLAADLQRYLDDQPIKARRPSLVDRARKWSRRHPSVVVASVLLLTVVAVGLFISNRLISRERKRAEARAIEAEDRFQQAQQAVNMLIQVGEKELVGDHMIREERLRLLRASLNYYQDFIDRQRGAITASPSELAAVQDRVRANLEKLTVLEQEHKLFDHELWMYLLWSPRVLEELHIAGDAQGKVVATLENWMRDWKAAVEETYASSGDERRQRFVKLTDKYRGPFDDCLSYSQQRRLHEVAMQTGALFRLKGPEVVRLLELPRTRSAYLRPFDPDASPRAGEALLSLGASLAERRGDPTIEDAVVILFTILTREWSWQVGPTAHFVDDSLLLERRAAEKESPLPSSD
ncbi:MAG: protein kinase domain-containing protein [Planctomycetaceae bacterium]